MVEIKQLSWTPSTKRSRASANADAEAHVLDQIVKMEKKIFPKHESLSCYLQTDVSKPNCGLLYALKQQQPDGDCNDKIAVAVAGYVMYSVASCLAASITKLAVKEQCRRQGIGEALMRAALQRCRDRRIQRVCLHVDPERSAAVALYRKLEFQVDAFVPSYYSQDRHAYRMFLDFS